LRVTVSAPSRLHITLLDLSGDLGFVDGGVGVAIKLPRTVVRAEPYHELSVEGPRAKEVRGKLSELGLTGKVVIENAPPPHMGFGSTTQLLLSSAKALGLINGIEFSVNELGALMGRGGTSGIGVKAFEEGGFIFDFGHSVSIKER
jgi:beta-ribofuranosylaminobenzene 5'-phosphate synthase